MHVQAYLNFDGRCDEAIEFYKTAIGARVEMWLRFKDSPDPHPSGQFPPDFENKVMHSTLLIGDSAVHASDGRSQGKMVFAGVMLSLAVASEAEVDQMFTGLSDGGKVTMPLGKTFFSPRFGMVTDRFGLSWMVVVQPKR